VRPKRRFNDVITRLIDPGGTKPNDHWRFCGVSSHSFTCAIPQLRGGRGLQLVDEETRKQETRRSIVGRDETTLLDPRPRR